MRHSDTIPDIPAHVVKKIIGNIRFGATTECWPFDELTDRYGTVNIGTRGYPAHRVVYKLFTGIDPMERYVCHRCDYKPCVNPHHMYLGNARTNMDDAVRRNRINRNPRPAPPERIHPDYLIAAEQE